MRARYDQFGKQMIRELLEGCCSVVTDAEVPIETRHIDLWVTPHESGAPPPDDLGLLGRITSNDQEFLMDTQDIVENWRREAIQEGVKQGLEQGERKLFLRRLRQRFGGEVGPEIERRVVTAPVEQIEVWAERVLSAATLAKVLED